MQDEFASIASDDWTRDGFSKIPIAVISLEDTQVRREELRKNSIPEHWYTPYWSATDMRNLRKEEIIDSVDVPAIQSRYSRSLRAAEIGCALSHKAIYIRILHLGFPLALVCEDDLVPNVSNFKSALVHYFNVLLSRAERGDSFICNLGMPEQLTQYLNTRKTLYPLDRPSHVPKLLLNCDSFRPIWRANAYFISRAAASAITEREESVAFLADDWSSRQRMGILDRVYLPERAIFTQNRFLESTIQRSHFIESSIDDGPAHEEGSRISMKRILKSLTFRINKQLSSVKALIPVHLPIDPSSFRPK